MEATPPMTENHLGKDYEDGEVIIRQGDAGDSMFVIQHGQVEVIVERDGKEVNLGTRGKGEIFGEMAVIDRTIRSATVRALGSVRLLTIDKRTFLQRISEDPSIAFRTLKTLSARIRELSGELARAKEQITATERDG